MEKRDLYDVNRVLTGETIYKGDKIPENKYIVVVISFMENSKGEFLIQKRTKAKKGLYGSTGGHPKSGETSLQGITTEIKEEIGLDVKPSELKLVFSDKQEEKQVFYDIYYLKKDFNISDLTLQKEEVESVAWLSKDKILSMMNDDLFLPSHVMCFNKLLNILNKEGEKVG